MRTHGHTTGNKRSRTAESHHAMKQRCLNPKHKSYPDYGGRGITVCERWMSFANFLEDMGLRPPGKTLDRIRVNEGYCKDNCKWSTSRQQQNNRRPYKRRSGATEPAYEDAA